MLWCQQAHHYATVQLQAVAGYCEAVLLMLKSCIASVALRGAPNAKGLLTGPHLVLTDDGGTSITACWLASSLTTSFVPHALWRLRRMVGAITCNAAYVKITFVGSVGASIRPRRTIKMGCASRRSGGWVK